MSLTASVKTIMSERASANFLKGSFRVNFSMGTRTGTRGNHDRTADSKISSPLWIAGTPLLRTLRRVRVYNTNQRSRRATGRVMMPMSSRGEAGGAKDDANAMMKIEGCLRDGEGELREVIDQR